MEKTIMRTTEITVTTIGLLFVGWYLLDTASFIINLYI